MISAFKTARRLNFSDLPTRMDEALSHDLSWLAALLSEKGRGFLFQGFGIGVGKMARLMFAEVAKLSLIFYSGASFRHGPVDLLADKPL